MKCPDRRGIVHEITGFIAGLGGNILELEQFVAQDEDEFFMRLVWSADGFEVPFSKFDLSFQDVQKKLGAAYWIDDSEKKDRMALFVSGELHCMAEVLSQFYLGNLPVDIPLIIGNHENAKELAEKFHIKFIHTPTKEVDIKEVEKTQIDILSRHKINLIGLARYMRILSADFIEKYPDGIINIHHSFLPAFHGANPYKQAYERGVKIIGATAHFVTEQLDQGPIIAQDTREIHHGYSRDLLRRAGQEIEKKVFIRALQKQLQRKIIRYGNKTVVFE